VDRLFGLLDNKLVKFVKGLTEHKRLYLFSSRYGKKIAGPSVTRLLFKHIYLSTMAIQILVFFINHF
jgi:hypothetical protein